MTERFFNARVLVLIIFRIMLFLVSGAGLACHAGKLCKRLMQISLLNRHSTSSDNPAPPTDWWPEYVVYTLYYVAHGFSCLCALVLILSTFQRKTIRPDRLLSIVNAALTIAVLVYNSISSGNIPWVGFADTPWRGPHDHTQKGLATYCSDYNGVDDAMITFKRCWLQNGAWLGLVITAALWCALALYVYIQTSSMIFRREEFALVTTTSSFAPLDDHHPHTTISSPSEEAARHFEMTMPLATNAAETNSVHPIRPVTYNANDSFDASQYPNHHYSYHDMQPYIPHLQARQISGSFDCSNVSSASNSMYHNPPPHGYYNNYEEKVAVSTPPSDHSISEPPHSHDGAKV
ncbi:hypothetical protein K492DRAFT_196673 [Lichtheimia hyalospora FSU 10163]|nr:hypothetical protein K492DRAFT_196673 [Lichtheimia hyalospora FSU 10163]